MKETMSEMKLAGKGHYTTRGNKALVMLGERLYVVCKESLLQDLDRLNDWASQNSKMLWHDGFMARKFGTLKSAERYLAEAEPAV